MNPSPELPDLEEDLLQIESAIDLPEHQAAFDRVAALARRAQPEGKVEEIVAVLMHLDANGMIAWRGTGDDEDDALDEAEAKARTAREVAKAVEALRAKPEGEAPQADTLAVPRELLARCITSMRHAVTFGDTGKGRPPSQTCMFEIEALAALLAGQPAAQHAESGALPITRSTYGLLEACEAERERRAALAAQSQGAQQAAAPGALLAILRDVHDTLASESDSDIDHFESDDEEREGAPVQYAARKVMEVMDMLKAVPSAPGTPEAPKGGADQKRIDWLIKNHRWSIRWRIHPKKKAEQWQMLDDGEPWGQWGEYRAILDAAMRAAQLDGGQGEGEKA